MFKTERLVGFALVLVSTAALEEGLLALEEGPLALRAWEGVAIVRCYEQWLQVESRLVQMGMSRGKGAA